MDDTISAPTPETPPRGGGIWRNLLYTILGTTISIVLTFGTSQLVQQYRKAQDRKMTALMVMGNIERFAQTVDEIAAYLSQCDTVATLLLAIPQDSLDSPEYQPFTQRLIYTFPAVSLAYDRTAEQIFSNSIETWKNVGNFGFIDNVGKCYSDMKSIEKEYTEYRQWLESLTQQVIDHMDEYPGQSVSSKSLRDAGVRRGLVSLHSHVNHYRYLADYIRYANHENMRMIGIDEEEVMRFVEEHKEELTDSGDEPLLDDYKTPYLEADSIPNAKAWLENLSR